MSTAEKHQSLRGPLPLMKTIDDAVAICEHEHDNFYVTAFMVEAWLGELTVRTMAESAEKKTALDRHLQTGDASLLFQETFGRAKDAEFPHLFECLLRFMEYDDVQSRTLRSAFGLLATEHAPMQCPVLHLPATSSAISTGIQYMRSLCSRLCEWLDAVVHCETHQFYYHSPVSFDPDPEKRELSSLGVLQRHYAELDDFCKAWWQWHHGEAAERFKNSPKWKTVGAAMASDQTRHQSYPEIDELVICLWPLLKKHNWTYRDLLNVTRSVAKRPTVYPLAEDRELATYCPNVLGLRKGGQGTTAANGKPAGFDVAMRLCGRASPAQAS